MNWIKTCVGAIFIKYAMFSRVTPQDVHLEIANGATGDEVLAITEFLFQGIPMTHFLLRIRGSKMNKDNKKNDGLHQLSVILVTRGNNR
jgi:hypothetical protein